MAMLFLVLACTVAGGIAPADFDPSQDGPVAVSAQEAGDLALREAETPELADFEGGSHVLLLVLLILLLGGGCCYCCC